MDHFVHLYQEVDALADAVAEYAGSGLRRGEAVVLIATPEHCMRRCAKRAARF
jgi:hypothetical protein